MLLAAVHLWVVPEHLEEWWGYGTFFLVCALAQGLYALGLLRRPSRPFLLLGVAGNLAVVILWLVTRTTDIPKHRLTERVILYNRAELDAWLMGR